MPTQRTVSTARVAEPAPQKYLRVAAVAAHFDVDVTTIYRDIKAGRLKAVRIGTGRGTVRVLAEALAEYEADALAAAAEVAA